MSYKNPSTVVSPKNRWKLGNVLCSTGQAGWSVAEGWWDEESTLGIRWNGDDDSGSPGNPQSHGNPTWFIVPSELHEAVRGVAFSLNDAMSFVTFKSERPTGWDFGVFAVTIEVHGQVRKTIEGQGVTFDVPTLPKRFFRHDFEHGYGQPPSSDGAPWRGRFVDGVWKSIVQTNGISEESNPTSMDIVRDALIASVMSSLAPWKLSKTPSLVSHHDL